MLTKSKVIKYLIFDYSSAVIYFDRQSFELLLINLFVVLRICNLYSITTVWPNVPVRIFE